jgi:hypothetical protein
LATNAIPGRIEHVSASPRRRFSDEDERLFGAARHGDVAAIERSLSAAAS